MNKSYKGIKTLEVLEGADNYNSWIASKIKPYVKSPALEIGAGTGNISSYFTDIEQLTLSDVDHILVKKLNTRFARNKNVHAEVFDVSAKLSNPVQKFNTIYSVNVLEHIKDDNKALANMYNLLNSSGKVIILVPAKKYAYRKIDKRLGHFRRYEKNELNDKLKNTGFKVMQIEYFNILGLLSWMVRDKITRKHEDLKPSHVQLFDLIVPFLRRIEPRRNLPAGISLIAIAKKQ